MTTLDEIQKRLRDAMRTACKKALELADSKDRERAYLLMLAEFDRIDYTARRDRVSKRLQRMQEADRESVVRFYLHKGAM